MQSDLSARAVGLDSAVSYSHDRTGETEKGQARCVDNWPQGLQHEACLGKGILALRLTRRQSFVIHKTSS